jgi:SnoaL-like domain
VDALTELTKWHEVFDLSVAYATAIDARDWAGYRAVFTDEVDIDFSSFTHRPARPFTADQWVDGARSLIDGFEATQHLLGNHVIGFDGNDAGHYTAYIQAQHWMSRDSYYTIGGHYENKVVRGPDGRWRLTSMTLHQTWDAGDRSLLRAAADRVRARA